jgi:glutamate--cysteine ligase
LLKDSPIIADQECDWIIDNQAKMVREGRRPDLMLHSARGQISMHTWGTEILAELREVALLMPDPQACISAINTLAERLADSSLTPSAQVLSAMQEGGMSYQQLIMQLAQQHQQYHLQQPLPADTLRQMQVDAQQSWLDQAQLEAEQTDTFDDFLAAYLAQ